MKSVEFSKNYELLKNILKEENDNLLITLKARSEQIDLSDKRFPLDLALRDRMLVLLTSKNKAPMKNLLKLSVDAAIDDICSASTPFVLFADFFNTNPISECQKMFSFMEETISNLKHLPIFASGRNILLRMCNDLLRRLSKSQNTVFCGHIQSFLSRLFPIDEKSGLNLMGNFNIEKDISFNKDPESHKTDSTKSNLYTKFWTLQEYFQNPIIIYDINHWKTFTENVSTVLSTFNTVKLDTVNESKNKWQECNTEFTKYLTSEKLLELQLMDIDFRRNILVQLLIIFQYLTNPVKFKSPEHKLTEDQKNWVVNKTKNVFSMLKPVTSKDFIKPKNEENISDFSDMINLVLDRETSWNQWKNDGCPSFIPSETQSMFELPVKKRRINPLIDRSGKQVYRFDSPVLNNLPWSTSEESLEACKDPKRSFKPDLKEYFNDAIIELDPEEKVEEQYKSINKEEWCWRSLRILARHSSHVFQLWEKPGLPLKDYLNQILTKDVSGEIHSNGNNSALQASKSSSSNEKTSRVDKSNVEKLDSESEVTGSEYEQEPPSSAASTDDAENEEVAGSDEGEVPDEDDDSTNIPRSNIHHKRPLEDREEGEEIDDEEE